MFGVRLVCNKKDLLLSIIFMAAIFYVLLYSNSISLKIFKNPVWNIILILCCVGGISAIIVLFTLHNPSPNFNFDLDKTRDFYLQVARIFATLAIIGSIAISIHKIGIGPSEALSLETRDVLRSQGVIMFKLAKYSIVLAVSFVLSAVVLLYARLNNRSETP